MILGAAGAIGWSYLHGRVEAIRNQTFTTPAFLLIIFSLAQILGFNGAIAALAFGVTLGNVQSIKVFSSGRLFFAGLEGVTEAETRSFGEFAFLLRTFFFVYLGVSLVFVNLQLSLIAVALAVLILIIRIPQ